MQLRSPFVLAAEDLVRKSRFLGALSAVVLSAVVVTMVVAEGGAPPAACGPTLSLPEGSVVELSEEGARIDLPVGYQLAESADGSLEFVTTPSLSPSTAWIECECNLGSGECWVVSQQGDLYCAAVGGCHVCEMMEMM